MTEDLHSSITDLVARYRAGQVVATQDEAQAWVITRCSRATWFRFMASPEAPAGMCLKLGRKRLLSLPVFLRWLNVDLDAAGAKAEADHAH